MRTFKPGQILIAHKKGELSTIINNGDKVTFLNHVNAVNGTISVLLHNPMFSGVSQIELASIFTSFPATRLKRKLNEHI